MQAIVQELKTLASDCNIPIIGLSQLNRCQNDTSCFLNPNNYRELPLDYLEDINLTCIYRGDYFKKYEYDSNGEVIYGKTRFIIYHDNSPEIIYLLFNYETKGFSMFPSVSISMDFLLQELLLLQSTYANFYQNMMYCLRICPFNRRSH